MAAHRRSDRRRVCRCAGGLRKRASRRRKPVRFAFGRVTNCVSAIATGDTRVRGEFDLVMPRRNVRADEKLTPFAELESATRPCGRAPRDCGAHEIKLDNCRDDGKSLLDFVIRQFQLIFGTAE